MSFFSQLPASVLQAGAIFLSIIIEALPFVLIGSIISGFIEVYVTPDKVYHLPFPARRRPAGSHGSELGGAAVTRPGSRRWP